LETGLSKTCLTVRKIFPRQLPFLCALLLLGACFFLPSCARRTEAESQGERNTEATASAVPTVGVVTVTREPLERSLTVSSELIPFQEIDVFAKESGYVNRLLVDYGTRVNKGQLLATLEIPELQMQLDQDRAVMKSQADQIVNVQHQLSRLEAQHKVVHLEYQRIAGVAQNRPGLVAQQEVDDVQGRDLAAEAQLEGARANVEAARSTLAASQAKLTRDQALYDYSRITAPFTGVITQRYANLGTLLASGTNSSTQAMPLVKLSELDLFRLVIPIPESYVRYVQVGDPVKVYVPSLNESFPGRVTRFAHDIHDATRTMHTEVDVPNPKGVLIPGLYAQATLTLNRSGDSLTLPIQAIDREDERTSVAVVDPNGRVELKPITLGMETESRVEVLSGLHAGEQVIVSDRAGLRPGQAVKAQPAPPLPATKEG
jgi:RND family efflux transporter MFP subunit